MHEIEYHFGSGAGAISRWDSVADWDVSGDGTADAVRLDFDGDGRTDDAMWDSDGDGLADTVALDLDDDGTVEHFYTDPTGTGVWSQEITFTKHGRRNAELPPNERVVG